jgi:2-keto-3-deoxy-L-fuconate dehydrogenase
MAAPRLAGKTCFVTGAAQGIGRAIAERFVAEGARVVAADLRFADEPAPSDVLQRLVLDVTDEAAVTAAAAAHRDVTVLVNCVGYVANGTVLDCTPADFDRSFDLNVRSMMLTTRAFLPAMLTRKDGSIINIASVVSSIMGAPNRFAYGASKAAVIGLTLSVARDFIAQGVRCNAISPGTVETPSLHERWAASGDLPAARAAFIARQPMGRLGRVEEIASTAVLLASDEATFMSGSNIVIDGGMSL